MNEAEIFFYECVECGEDTGDAFRTEFEAWDMRPEYCGCGCPDWQLATDTVIA